MNIKKLSDLITEMRAHKNGTSLIDDDFENRLDDTLCSALSSMFNEIYLESLDFQKAMTKTDVSDGYQFKVDDFWNKEYSEIKELIN